MILEVFSSSEYILQKILVQILLKFVFILIAYRDVGFAKNDAATFNGIDPVEVNDKRPMYPHEFFFRKFLVERFHGIK